VPDAISSNVVAMPRTQSSQVTFELVDEVPFFDAESAHRRRHVSLG
jgi:hypothetical protein